MSESTPISPPAEEVAVVFKSKKNRKQLRTRPNTENDDAQSFKSPTQNQAQHHQPRENSTHETQDQKPQHDDGTVSTLSRPATATSDDAKSPTQDDDSDATPAVSSVMRKAKRPRLMGIAFHTAAPGPDDGHRDDDISLASPPTSATTKTADKNVAAAVVGGIKRFAPQTGIMGTQVNQHMEQYIESQLTRRQSSAQESTSPVTANQSTPSGALFCAHAPTLKTPTLDGQKPTQLGKLMEVDLGDEARIKTLDMIERARRSETAHDSGSGSNKRKTGCDRRGSQDLKRDQIVESFLHENRLDIYDVPKQPTTANESTDNINDLPADDRVAEQFRRDFIDAMSQRVRRRRATRAPAQPPANRPGAKRDDEVLKGPKLGGSRNVRAQMRDILLQKEKEKERDRRR